MLSPINARRFDEAFFTLSLVSLILGAYLNVRAQIFPIRYRGGT
jgi:hypothetical protein